MKDINISFKKNAPTAGVLLLAPLVILSCMAAMNGGTALAASSFDTVVATLEGILTSTWTIMLVIIVLIGCVWRLAHGGSYASVGLIIGILALALIGPGMVVSIATAMPTSAQVQQVHMHHLQARIK